MEICINFKKLVVLEGGEQKMHPSDILHLSSRLQRYRSIQYLVESFGKLGKRTRSFSFQRKYRRKNQKSKQMWPTDHKLLREKLLYGIARADLELMVPMEFWGLEISGERCMSCLQLYLRLCLPKILLYFNIILYYYIIFYFNITL